MRLPLLRSSETIIQASCILCTRKAVPCSWDMKEHDVRQRIESFLKRTLCVPTSKLGGIFCD